MVELKMRKGAVDGALLALLIIISQPFHPPYGLIPELVSFFTAVPLWIAALIFQNRLNPLVEGGVVLVYLILIGSLLGIAFDRKKLWGWLLLIAFAIHHYIVYDQYGRRMGEVVQSFLNLFS